MYIRKVKNGYKSEIKNIFKKYRVSIENISDDKDLQLLMQEIENHIPTEKPDAYLSVQNIVYAIEHFQISQYNLVKKIRIYQEEQKA